MGLEPNARLVVNRKIDVRTLPLQPEEFFVLTRVESLGGESTVADALSASPQPAAEALATLERLVELEALEVVTSGGETPHDTPRAPSRATSAAKPGASGSSDELRRRARNRRRELLEAQMRAARGASAGARSRTEPATSGGGDHEEPSLPAPRPGQPPARPADGLGSILDEVEPVAANDPRLEPSAAVELDRQRRLLALRDRLRHVGHFTLLGLEPVDDPKAIRRAYHVVSREFHPDSFYGKNLGSFRGVLDDLFRRARASYEFLLDPARRRPLVDAHLAQLEAERMEVEQRQARSNAAAQHEREAKRKTRDTERAQRIRTRAVEQRRRQAKKHAEQAEAERRAGRHGTAATLFRLAYEQDPTHAAYEQQWRDSLATARRARAEASYEEGQKAMKSGRKQDAARYLGQAAEADPTLRNLAAAAAAHAEVHSDRARDFAMSALETLQQSEARGLPLDPEIVARVHRVCAKAFLAAGQTASAREQAERAHAIAPSEQTLTLLNSIKLT